jgi:hypothetical protein
LPRPPAKDEHRVDFTAVAVGWRDDFFAVVALGV